MINKCIFVLVVLTMVSCTKNTWKSLDIPKLEVPVKYAYIVKQSSANSSAIHHITLYVTDGEYCRFEAKLMSSGESKVLTNSKMDAKARELIYHIKDCYIDAGRYIGKVDHNGNECFKFTNHYKNNYVDTYFDVINTNIVYQYSESKDKFYKFNYFNIKLTSEQWKIIFEDTNSWLDILSE